jgi:thiol-disulfide isomerase/thioredoxin
MRRMNDELHRRGLLAWAGLAALGGGAQAEEAAKPKPLSRVAPDAPLGQTLDGKALSLSDYAGMPVVVFFWASWCPQCRNELPLLERLQSATGKQRLRIIAVNVEEKSVFRKLHRALSEASQMVLTYDPENVSSRAFGRPPSIPYTLVVRPDATVASTQSGWGEHSLDFIVEHVNATLAEPGRAPGG